MDAWALRKRSGYDKGSLFQIMRLGWILRTISNSKAKNIFFHHGDSGVLNKYLNENKSLNVLFFENQI